jgi:hypothetical protein
MSTLDASLPGADLVERGVTDLRSGRETEAALLVTIAAPRLRALGLDIPDQRRRRGANGESAEHRLYALLASTPGGGAYSRYNALLARMVSFARAAEHASPR